MNCSGKSQWSNFMVIAKNAIRNPVRTGDSSDARWRNLQARLPYPVPAAFAGLAFPGDGMLNTAKLAIFVASAMAGIAGSYVLKQPFAEL
jgi:hypothetical protein